ncbi:MAG: hypothetical protein KDA91_12895 [Planctomycetaceae bacterium]|nr:hypothetical protein [Planctomycetaceae bacterium]
MIAIRQKSLLTRSSSNRFLPVCALATLLISLTTGTCTGQSPGEMYHPLNHRMPPGMAAGMLNSVRGYNPSYLQPVRVELPTDGIVSVYSASTAPSGNARTPAQFSINAGHVYRLRLSELPELPGAEIYPTIELLDHLHPPAGMEHNFPVPVVFSLDDLQVALSGKLVTRIIYLEQPSMAQLLDPLRREIPQTVSPADNALKEADRLGRPIAIVRIGGRTPAGPDDAQFYYGTGGGVDMTVPEIRNPGFVRLSSDARPALASN